jgi:hypothetical protein
MTCKGICIRHQAVRPLDGYRDSNGQKRCRVCDLFIKWDGVKCPCCGMTLSTRLHSRSKKMPDMTHRSKVNESSMQDMILER